MIASYSTKKFYRKEESLKFSKNYAMTAYLLTTSHNAKNCKKIS